MLPLRSPMSILNSTILDWNSLSFSCTNPALPVFPCQWVSLLSLLHTGQSLGIHLFPLSPPSPPYLLAIKSCGFCPLNTLQVSLCHHFLCPLPSPGLQHLLSGPLQGLLPVSTFVPSDPSFTQQAPRARTLTCSPVVLALLSKTLQAPRCL